MDDKQAQRVAMEIVMDVVQMVLERARKHRLADQAVIVVGSSVRAALTEIERTYYGTTDEEVAWAEQCGAVTGRSLGEMIAEGCISDQKRKRA